MIFSPKLGKECVNVICLISAFLNCYGCIHCIQMGDREKTQTNYLQFLLEITPVVSQIGNCGVFKAENISADCLAFLEFSV